MSLALSEVSNLFCFGVCQSGPVLEVPTQSKQDVSHLAILTQTLSVLNLSSIQGPAVHKNNKVLFVKDFQ